MPPIPTLLATLPAAMLETVLTHLATLFLIGTAGDTNAARQAAAQTLAAYHPETEEELRLAANIIGFSLHALEALGQAATPDMPLTRVLRLRGGAVSLNREAHKAERRLAQLQKARRQGNSQQPDAAQHEPTQANPTQANPTQANPTQAQPKIEAAIIQIQDTRKTATVAKTNGLTWTQAHEQRMRDKRIAASLQRAEARVAAQANTASPAAPAMS